MEACAETWLKRCPLLLSKLSENGADVDASTQAFFSSIATAVAAVAAVSALIVAVIALVVARRTLGEARSTTEAQRETLQATQSAVTATEYLAGRIELSTRVLHQIFAEAQATRVLEQLRRVADQLAVLTRWRRAVRKASLQPGEAPWHDHNDAQALLGAHLEGLAPEELPKSREMATADPRYTDGLDDQAAQEIKNAIASARTHMEQLSATAGKELSRVPTGQR
jgi:hypothetical protein